MSTIEIIVVRDPDGDNEVSVYLDGKQTQEYVLYSIDAGRGYDLADWEEARESAIEQASSDEVAAALDSAYGDPPGEEYIDGWRY